MVELGRDGGSGLGGGGLDDGDGGLDDEGDFRHSQVFEL